MNINLELAVKERLMPDWNTFSLTHLFAVPLWIFHSKYAQRPAKSCIKHTKHLRKAKNASLLQQFDKNIHNLESKAAGNI